jgi:hypothetical protein
LLLGFGGRMHDKRSGKGMLMLIFSRYYSHCYCDCLLFRGEQTYVSSAYFGTSPIIGQ